MRGAAWGCAILGCAVLLAQTAADKPQFEVASVKPAAEKELRARPPMLREMRRASVQPGRIPMASPGRIRLRDWALVDLIAAAYRVRVSQVLGPAWISDQSFDVEAKVPEGAPKEQVNAMLQSLLEERFGLKTHRGAQSMQGFALVVGKNGPKLKPAEVSDDEDLTPEQRRVKMQKEMAAMQERMQDNRQSGTPVTGVRTAWWDSVTTEELAAQLISFAEAPVVDQTGLTGKYNVRIETWTNPDVPGGTVFDAVEKLGLKLEPRKVTVETVVVDQVAKTPAAN